MSFHIRSQLMQMHRCYSKCLCVCTELQLLTKSSRLSLPNYFPDSWFSVITPNHLLGIWSRPYYSFCFFFCTSYLVNPVLFTFREGYIGGERDPNTAEKVNEHRITARKVGETPSPSHIIRFEITATPQIEILFTASKKHQHRNTANPHVPLEYIFRDKPLHKNSSKDA